VFRLSKINLCPTARGIRSGLPLRMLDIIGSGGFLLCNAQPELVDYFRPDIDIVCYSSIEDAVEKARYYLSHEDERLRIQQNSYAIIEEKFSYPERIATMFQTAGL
ncbi:MAG: glycosyltransferase, partial [Lachnospiraceae bacterium]|nr:glycosyltransferase [Lachnospiraceae bacterium]